MASAEKTPPSPSLTGGQPAVPLPCYGRASLADLAPSLLHALGVGSFANPLRVEPAARVCLLVVDGLGWELVRAHSAEAPFLASLAETASPLTAGFPSTTAVSLASIGTGQPPGEHGIVGYTVAMPGYERTMNTLRWALHGEGTAVDLLQDIVPEQVQPQLTALERAAMDGVAVTLLGPALHERSGLTRAAFRGGRYRAVYSLGDLGAEAARALVANRRGFVYAYHPDLDLTGHNRGVSSDAWRLHLGLVDRLAARLAERLPADAVLVITGDHGMVDLAADERIDLADVPALAAGVRLLGGEPRARYVYARPGAVPDVLATWRALLGDHMWIASRDEAIAAGWFGPRVLDHVRPRIGDIVAAAHGQVGVVQRLVDPREALLIGHHGSMTAHEQLVPFLVVRR